MLYVAYILRAGKKKVSVKKKSGSKTLIKIYTNPKEAESAVTKLVLLQQPMPGGTLNLQIHKILLENGSCREVYNIHGTSAKNKPICVEVEKYSGMYHIVPREFLIYEMSQTEKNECLS